MLKPLLVLAYVVFAFFISSSEGSSYSIEWASSTSSVRSHRLHQNEKSPICDVNEIYDTCANSGCRRWICSQPEYCIDANECQGGCVCQQKYARAENGTCIPEDQCASTCGLNEVYDTCANGGCRKWNCSEFILCIDPITCEAGCTCRDGYSRDKNGICILENQCPGRCNKPHEYYAECPTTCSPQTCESIGKVYHCPVQLIPSNCEGKCLCEEGYYRNFIGECISEEDCKKCTGPHEYHSCGGACDNVCATINKQNQTNCPIYNIVCNSKCYCEPGYARDENNICIPIHQCPEPQCADDEIRVYEECPSNLCTPQKCAQLGYPLNCSSSDDCQEGPSCICDNGNVRDDEGNCIPADQCPSCGGDRNAVIGCGNNCGRRCSDYKEKKTVCPLFCLLNGCKCRDGFVYDGNLKKCVRPEECTPTCGIHEVYDTCANDSCRRWNCSESIRCVDRITCKPGCICQEGYSRANNGTCVPEDQCPEPQCGPNERFEQCPDTLCSPQTCSQVGFPIDCATYDSSCPGRPGCVCDNGYVRDDNGNCIPPSNCPSCGGDPKAVSGCGINCGRLCSNFDKGPVLCLKICKVNSCDCIEGFVLDQNTGKCVRPTECTPTCGLNEVYDTCANGGCRKWNCSEFILCIDPITCEAGCTCRDGYSRDKNGICILENQCPAPTCGLNEVYDTCANGGCRKWNCSEFILCIDPITCEAGCTCRDGYSRDKNGICILENQCPAPTICGLNEVYDTCANGGCRKWNCSEFILCIDPITCEAGCTCRDGYSRDKNGICILENQCQGRCNKPHEYYAECPTTCSPQTCESIGKVYHCPVQLIPSNCEGKCLCEEGYYRNFIGDCISEEDCKKCTGPHEYHSCGGACDNVCATINKQNQTNCPIYNIVCNSKCYCEPGYARDENNICIPIHQCPEPQCADDEIYEECPSNLCTPQKCAQLGYPLNCSSSDDCQDEPSCICDNGNVRDDEGNCIPADQCPSCGGDPNAVIGCGNNCGRRCSDYKENKSLCPLFCLLNGCECRDGFVYDGNLKKCVRPEECTPTCGIHEVYDTCANDSCRRWNCSESIRCVDRITCKPGCTCQEGYSRANNGTCIPEDQCPEPQCGPNERFEQCPDTLCSPQTCSQVGFPIDCATYDSSCPGRPGCVCDRGYVRDDNGNCIPPSNCPSCGGDTKAVSGCGINCGRLCSNFDKGPVACLKICKVNSCDCKEGFVLDQNIGKCVHPKDCTPICGKNEVYSECINGGCQRKYCSQLGKEVSCVTKNPVYCIKGCVCKEKYLRADNGTCIPEHQCRNRCERPHEYYEECVRSCSPQTCESIGRRYRCLRQRKSCKGACRCEKGYFRNKIGQCITARDCKKCTGPHEYFSCGGACDNVCATLHKQNQTHYPIINKKCNSRCYCEKGYARNDKNICIPINQCQVAICGPNERYQEKPSVICEPLKCSELGFPLNCSRVEDLKRDYKPACICKEDYVRDNRGFCVPRTKCPSCGGDRNATAGCGVNCGKTCSTYGKEVSCIQVCFTNACDCRDGFVYHEVLKRCVKYEDCDNTCDGSVNEGPELRMNL